MSRRTLALALLLLSAASCGSSSDGPNGSPTPAPVGGPTQTVADQAVLGLCEIESEHTEDLAAALATFHDRSHEALHSIAATAQEVDRAAAARLLEAKQRVEADLAESDLPSGFAEDVDSLIKATAEALRAIGLRAPACPA